MSHYHFKEIFLTLQGEGGQAGRTMVFARFSGCNLWSGREIDRSNAICRFCDTDFVGTDGQNGGRFQSVDEVVRALIRVWGEGREAHRGVVFTGGEPLLQLDALLIKAVKEAGFYIAVETNGTIIAPDGIDWLCVSPKSTATVVQTNAQELKLAWPQDEIDLQTMESFDCERFYLQPIDGAHLALNTKLCIETCLQNPKWRLSVQTHKVIGID
jgi:7-carboxy-7-deazaguanine synthase (Cx14CxxC type)